METEQTTLLIDEEELVRLAIESGPSAWVVYKGLIDGRDSFAVQGYQRGYPTPAINSLRAINRDSLEYDPKKKIVKLLIGFSSVTYDIGHPKHDKLAGIFRSEGVWEEPLR